MSMEINKESRPHAKNDRKTIAEKIVIFEKKLEETSSQRKAAKLLGVPRSTVQYWAGRKAANPLPDIIVDCFESPEGLLFVHRLITAAQFVMTEIGGCGIRLVSLFIRLSQLDQFVACSYGTLQKRGVAMEKEIVKFGQQERETLTKSMQPCKISMAEDETFHPRICLVGIEPVSNFILLEKYSDKRDAKSWNAAVDEALSGMPVKIVQTTSDEAKGILCHTKKHLGAHHSSDIFHVQYELTKATAAPLAAKSAQAEKLLAQCEKATQQAKQKKTVYERATKPRRRGRAPNFNKDIATAQQQENDARFHLQSCEERQANVRKAKKGISEVYHPYDLKTGRARNCDELKQALDGHIDTIKEASKQSSLSQSCHNRIAKAARVCKGLLATLTFFWMMVSKHISEMSLSGELEKLMYDDLIPIYYLQIAAKKAKRVVERDLILKQSSKLLKALDKKPQWNCLDELTKNRLQKAAKQCAQRFQRSSSCVEGRNGYLSLRHHGLHHLSDRKLSVLTAIHNFYIKRPDKTTAAERFFGQKPRDLFEVLVEQLDLPARPAKPRTKDISMAA